MKKLILNKETLVSLSPERLFMVNGAMQKETWTDDCGPSARRACITDSPCNTDQTCFPRCYTHCQGGMSKPDTQPDVP